MEEKENNVKAVMSEAEKSGIAKKKAINRAASYFSDDDSLFEFEGFEIENIAKDVSELEKKEEQLSREISVSEKADVSAPETVPEEKGVVSLEAGTKGSVLAETGAKEPDSMSTEATETESKGSTLTEKVAEASEKEVSFSEQESKEKMPVPSEKYNGENGVFESGRQDTYTEAQKTDADKEDSDDCEPYGSAETEVKTEEGSEDNVVYSVEKQDEGAKDNFKEEPYEINETEDTENAFDEIKESSVNKGYTKKYSDELIAYSNIGETVNAEGQLHFEGTEDEFFDEIVADKGADSGEEDSDVKSESGLVLSEDASDELYDEADLDNELWDRAGKEEWEARESFLSYCKTLTLPQVKTGNYGSAEPEVVKTKVTSSGYRYAESERIPVFSDGFNGGVDKAGYAERERRYCESRRVKRDVMLREKTRSLHRAMLYTALILFTVLLLEILNFAFKGQELMFASIEIGLILLGSAFVWKGLCDGVRCAVRGVFIPELLSLLTVILSLVYATITACYPGEGAVLIGLPGAVAIFLTALYRSLMARREKKVFDITAEYGDYCTEVRLASFKGSPEEVAFGGYASESSSLYKTNRIARADAGYNVQSVRDECFGLVKVLLICIVCAAIACGIAFGFIKRDPFFGFFSAYLLVSLGSPFCAFLSLSLPRYIISEDVAEDGAAIADFDDESEEFDENVIMLREEELFPADKIKILDAYWSNSHFLEAHLSKAAAAFRKTGGLLSGLFAGIDISGAVYREPVITDISDNGITVKVDDSLVRAGTDAYLEKHGIEIERYPDIPQKDTRVLYIANNGEFFSRIVIQFVPDERLCRKMAELRTQDTLFSLKTCNPCIDSSLVFYTTGLEPELLRVVKYMVEDDVCEPNTDREGYLVSRTGAGGLFSALLGYKRQKKLVLLGSRLAALSGLLGVLLALAVSLSGIKLAFISFIVLGFHLVTSAVAVAIGISARKRRDKKR